MSILLSELSVACGCSSPDHAAVWNGKIKPGAENVPDAGYRSGINQASDKASPGYYAVFL